MKKLLIPSIIICIVLATGGYIWYTNSLQEAKKVREEAQKTSRAVPSKSSSSPQPPTEKTPQTTPQAAPTVPTLNQQNSTNSVLKKGSFTTLDPVHYASGEVTLEKSGNDVLVNFSESFKTNPDGPDLYVWLVKEQKLGLAVNGVNTEKSTYLDLGPLSKVSGSQSYKISQSEYETYNYAVVIWCRAFSVQFSNAVLN
jgi:hypothetical protein